MTNPVMIAIPLIKRWEGCRLLAYPDPATGGDPWTIGWGSTGPSIQKGTVWTQEQADADLVNRVILLYDKMKSLFKNAPTDNEFGAMLSLSYNIGLGDFSKSTLLQLFNRGDIEQAADQFLVWKLAAGKVMQGLLNRRKDERNVFLS